MKHGTFALFNIFISTYDSKQHTVRSYSVCHFIPDKRVHSAKILSMLVTTQSVRHVSVPQQMLVPFF